jgi:hypothetical protein
MTDAATKLEVRENHEPVRTDGQPDGISDAFVRVPEQSDDHDAERDLSQLATQINAAHSAARAAASATLEHALRCGELLSDAKAQVPHGGWLPWLKDNCPEVSSRTAQRYVQLHGKRAEIQMRRHDAFGGTIEASLALISKPRPKPRLETAPARATILEITSMATCPIAAPPAIDGGAKDEVHISNVTDGEPIVGPAPAIKGEKDAVSSLPWSDLSLLRKRVQRLLDDLHREGKKNSATISPRMVLDRVVLLERGLIEGGILPPNKRYERSKAKSVPSDGNAKAAKDAAAERHAGKRIDKQFDLVDLANRSAGNARAS